MRFRVSTEMKYLVSLLGFGFCAGIATGFANDGAMHDGSRGPEPLEGVESPVRMMSEHIEVQFGAQKTTVHCTFHFRNTRSGEPVSQLLGFPDEGAAIKEARERGWTLMDPTLSPILSMRTMVDGKPAKSELKLVEVAPGAAGGHFAFWDAHHEHGMSAWYTLRVNFPAGRDVTVERFYTVEDGWTMPGVAYFHYTTETGAAWQGTIGRLQADITLRGGLTARKLIWPGTVVRESKFEAGDFATTHPERPTWHVRDARHLRLVWKEFEPGKEPEHRGFTVSCRNR
jgi:hypothetical protein